MKNIFKKVIATGLLLALAGSFAACGQAPATNVDAGTAGSDQKQNQVIKIGASITPHSEILEEAKPLLEAKGITLEIVKIEDSITPNTGVI